MGAYYQFAFQAQEHIQRGTFERGKKRTNRMLALEKGSSQTARTAKNHLLHTYKEVKCILFCTRLCVIGK